jgi:hypothetical protein
MRPFFATAMTLAGLVLSGCGGTTVGHETAVHGDGGVGPASDASTPEQASDASAADGETADAAVVCEIAASSYDTSCNVDTDCVSVTEGLAVHFGDWCTGECFCGADAINRSSAAQYAQDVTRTPVGSGATRPSETCSCPASVGGTCCRAGQCTTGGACVSALPLDAGAATNPSSANPGYTVLCVADAGASDAAYDSGVPATSGASRWCNGPEKCTSFNGGWACCTVMAGISMCVNP